MRPLKTVKLAISMSTTQLARSMQFLAAATFFALACLFTSATPALAADGVVSFFGGEGIQGGKFSNAGNGPGGIAVNSTGAGGVGTGDIYVVDRGNNRIQQFTKSGEFVRAFGLDVGGLGVNVCTVAASCVAGTLSAAAGGMSNPQGIAVDQDTGNLYVTDQGNRRVDVFSASGDFQGAFGWKVAVAGEAEELQFCTTATGCQAGSTGAAAGQFDAALGYPAVAPAGSPAAGNIYVADRGNRRVDQFEPTITAGEVTGISFVRAWGWGVDTGAPEFQTCTTASLCQAPNTSSPTGNAGQFSSNQPIALTVDSTGAVYAAESTGNNRVQKFNSVGSTVAYSAPELSTSSPPVDIAANPSDNHLLGLRTTPDESTVVELDSGGNEVKTYSKEAGLSGTNGLAVDSGTGAVYVARTSGQEPGVLTLGTTVPPTVTIQSPNPLEETSATLRGTINPNGAPTSYRFEYSADNGNTWLPASADEADAGSGTSAIPVSQPISGLVGNSQYRARLIATKKFGGGSTTSSVISFTTLESAPVITAVFSSSVTTNRAVLNAKINPERGFTTYHFEYGLVDCAVGPCTATPIPDAAIGSGQVPVGVFKEISGLNPGSTYHFRVVASNEFGTTAGADQTFNTYQQFVPQANCANQSVRNGFSSALPDCRAYEMVSPVEKNGADIAVRGDSLNYMTRTVQASENGDRITYSSFKAFANQAAALYSNQYLSSRQAAQWDTEGINAPGGLSIAGALSLGGNTRFWNAYEAFSPDLSTGWLYNTNKTPITPAGVPGEANFYQRNIDGSFAALGTGGSFYGASIGGFSDDLNHVFVTTEAGEDDIYDYSNGTLHLVSVLPDGSPSLAAGIGSFDDNQGVFTTRFTNQYRAVSSDGSRVYWSTTSEGLPNAGAGGEIYLRENPAQPQSALNGSNECTEPGKACTVQVWPEPSGAFVTAARDGSAALIYILKGTEGRRLYQFDANSKSLTLIAGGVEGVLGASDDLDRIYFVSTDDLADGAVPGGNNLYIDQGGSISLIATLSAQDLSIGGSSPVASKPSDRYSRVTPDGERIAFMSNLSLTGYDNTDVDGEGSALEVFTYDAGSGDLSCASCNPSGARPVTSSLIRSYSQPAIPATVQGSQLPAAGWIPSWEHALHPSRLLSADGERLFFNSFDALVPEDTNGVQDVYEWELPGAGDCTEGSSRYSELNEGCVSLISSGQSPQKSEFLDASVDGDDVFFLTNSSLVPQDPGKVDVYDARVGGGYPVATRTSACEGETCQSPPAAPNDPTPSSSAYRGPGNLSTAPARTCARNKVRRKGRCVKKARKRAKQSAKRTQNGNRRTAR